jgi:hypothetical protein
MSSKHLNLKIKDHFFCMNSENWLLQLASRHDMHRSVGEALCTCKISIWCFSFSGSAYSINLICDQEDAGAGLDKSLLFWESNLFTEWGLTAHKCTRKTVTVHTKKKYWRSSGTVHNYHVIIFCPSRRRKWKWIGHTLRKEHDAIERGLGLESTGTTEKREA